MLVPNIGKLKQARQIKDTRKTGSYQSCSPK